MLNRSATGVFVIRQNGYGYQLIEVVGSEAEVLGMCMSNSEPHNLLRDKTVWATSVEMEGVGL